MSGPVYGAAPAVNVSLLFRWMGRGTKEVARGKDGIVFLVVEARIRGRSGAAFPIPNGAVER